MATAHINRPLTTKFINSLKPQAAPYRSPDYPRTGLNLSVLVSGTKKWVLAYTSPINKKRVFWTIGTYPAIELAEARQRVSQYRKLISDGIDPREQDRQQKAEVVRESSFATVNDVLELYIEDLKLDNKITYKSVQTKLKKYIGPRVGSLLAKNLTVRLAAEMLGDIQETATPNISKRCRTYCSTAWTLALGIEGNIRWVKLASNYGLETNPFLLIKAPQNTEGVCDRFLSKEEISFFWHDVTPDKMDIQFILALKFLLATGQRPQEVLYARWADFDLNAGLWIQPWDRRKTMHKVKQDHIVPLNNFHLELLKQIKETGGDSAYLFPSKKTLHDTPRSKNVFSKAVRNYIYPKNEPQRMAVFTAKSARKSVKTLGIGEAGISKEHLDRLQGHSISDVSSRHYDKNSYLAEKTTAMNQWTTWLQTAIDGTARAKDSKIILLGDA